MKIRPIPFMPHLAEKVALGEKTQTRRLRGLEAFTTRGELLRVYPAEGTAVFGDSIPDDPVPMTLKCPWGGTGDALWVREPFAAFFDWRGKERHWYDVPKKARTEERIARVIYAGSWGGDPVRFVPAMFMFRWLSRTYLEISDLRVQRVHDISEADAHAEGVDPVMSGESWSAYDPLTDGYPAFLEYPRAERYGRLENIRHHPSKVMISARDQFKRLWNTLHRKQRTRQWLDLGRPDAWSSPFCWALTFSRMKAREVEDLNAAQAP